MGKHVDTEVKKAKDRKQEFSPDQVALERAREKVLGGRPSAKDRAAFRKASEKVVAKRQAERRLREADGPPTAAPGDAVVRVGGSA